MLILLIKNGFIYDSETSKFVEKEVYVSEGKFVIPNGKIVNTWQNGANETLKIQTLDAKGLYVIPGLIDLHFHGCAGYDFCDGTKKAIESMTAYQAEHGITAVAPATMTLDDTQLKKICINAASHKGVFKKGHAEVIGINMEGPYIAKSKKGAQNALYIRRPEAGHFRRMNEYAEGMIKITALAPETEGAFEFIDEVNEEVRISIAHTAADYKLAERAFKKGAKQVTHLFNAMNPFTHREPGVVGAAFDNLGVSVELICDGVHIMPSMIRAACKLFGTERIIMISDSMMAAGLSEGTYTLGGQKVIVKGDKAVLSDGTIAGSVTNLMDCFRYAISCGLPLESLINCVTKNPAIALNAYDKYGSIEEGKYANFVLLDKEYNLKDVYIRGIKN